MHGLSGVAASISLTTAPAGSVSPRQPNLAAGTETCDSFVVAAERLFELAESEQRVRRPRGIPGDPRQLLPVPVVPPYCGGSFNAGDRKDGFFS